MLIRLWKYISAHKSGLLLLSIPCPWMRISDHSLTEPNLIVRYILDLIYIIIGQTPKLFTDISITWRHLLLTTVLSLNEFFSHPTGHVISNSVLYRMLADSLLFPLKFVHPSFFNTFIHRFIRLSVCLSIHLSVRPFVHPFINPFIRTSIFPNEHSLLLRLNRNSSVWKDYQRCSSCTRGLFFSFAAKPSRSKKKTSGSQSNAVKFN